MRHLKSRSYDKINIKLKIFCKSGPGILNLHNNIYSLMLNGGLIVERHALCLFFLHVDYLILQLLTAFYVQKLLSP